MRMLFRSRVKARKLSMMMDLCGAGLWSVMSPVSIRYSPCWPEVKVKYKYLQISETDKLENTKNI